MTYYSGEPSRPLLPLRQQSSGSQRSLGSQEPVAPWTEYFTLESTADPHHREDHSRYYHHTKQQHPQKEEYDEPPSNESLLGIAFVTFFVFTVAQAIAAIFFAHSQAMLGDCWAMLVDAATYLLNYGAEKGKQALLSNTPPELEMEDESSFAATADSSKPSRRRRRRPPHVVIHEIRRNRILLELIPPLASVATLVVVTILVSKRALATLLHPTSYLDVVKEDENNNTYPSLALMMIFSFANLVLDAVNVACFARGHGMEGVVRGYTTSTPASPAPVIQTGSSYGTIIPTIPVVMEEDKEEDEANLNMCSAYTHVMADTLRSIAVLVAAGIASLFPHHITPELADAGAALIVSLIIAISLVPLFGGLIATFGELRALHHQYTLEQEQKNKTIQPMH